MLVNSASRSAIGSGSRSRLHGPSDCCDMSRTRHAFREPVGLPVPRPGQTNNNTAERSLRHAGIWRQLSFGTQSDAGSRFGETMLNVTSRARRDISIIMRYIADRTKLGDRTHRGYSSTRHPTVRNAPLRCLRCLRGSLRSPARDSFEIPTGSSTRPMTTSVVQRLLHYLIARWRLEATTTLTLPVALVLSNTTSTQQGHLVLYH